MVEKQFLWHCKVLILQWWTFLNNEETLGEFDIVLMEFGVLHIIFQTSILSSQW